MKNNVELGIIICTYNRRKYLLHNLNILNTECKSFIKRVYVIDNASNININYSNDLIKIFHNRNLGGSGGYARGMYEAKRDGVCTHIMLMDDDISFSSDSIKHAVNEIKKNKSNEWIGFAMTTFENPNIVYEAGAYWNGINVRRNNKGLDLNKSPNFNTNKYNYAGWWSLIMPIAVIDLYGYPFPFFVKFDDVEYSFRRLNEKIKFDQNFFVVHESFKNKKNLAVRYYGVRNGFIINDLYLKHSLFLSINYYFLRFIKLYVLLRFGEIKSMNYGFYDYLKGPCLLFCNQNPGKMSDSTESRINKKVNIFIGLIAYPFIVIKNIMVFIFSHHALRRQYKEQYKTLITEDFWANKFIS